MNAWRRWLLPVPGMTPWRFYGILLVIALEIVLAYCVAQQNNPFFYQAF